MLVPILLLIAAGATCLLWDEDNPADSADRADKTGEEKPQPAKWKNKKKSGPANTKAPVESEKPRCKKCGRLVSKSREHVCPLEKSVPGTG